MSPSTKFASLSSLVIVWLLCSMSITSAANSLRATPSEDQSWLHPNTHAATTNYIRPPDRNLGKVGDDDVDPRIINGNDASRGAWPFFVRYGGCGGSLITQNYVLTAGHCGSQSEGTKLRVSAYDQDPGKDDNDIVRGIADYSFHPNYRNLEYDFLLLKLDEPVTGVEFANINSENGVPSEDERLKVIGLGRTDYSSGARPDVLQEVLVPTHTMEYCQSAYGGFDQDTMFCAGDTTYDSCVGDSGGPIMTQNRVQVGLTSFGDDCAKEGKPGVYARISFAYNWILGVACENDSSGVCSSGGPPPQTPSPTAFPTPSPTELPTPPPTGSPTTSPTAFPTPQPTTASPTSQPSPAPVIPTMAPVAPTEAPSMKPIGANDGSQPDNNTEPPVSPTEPPVSPSLPPVSPTEPPVSPMESPVSPTEPPFSSTEPPVSPTEPPVTPTVASATGSPVSAPSPTSVSPFECGDSTDESPVDTMPGLKSCADLAANFNSMGNMCDFVDVSLACMETCGLCQMLSIFYESNTAAATGRNGVRV